MTSHRLLALLLALAVITPAFGAELRQPRERLFTSGQPGVQQLHEAAAAGVTTVIDLRTPQEDRGYDEQATAEKLGLRYVRLPIGGAGDINEANARTLDRLLKQDAGTTLLHCASGNRVGALLALARARVDGASSEEALQFGRDAGLGSLEPVVRKELGVGEE
ncbi:MAG: sulfur transferase domain-containing protein [Stenotrophomonas sp.]